MEWISVEDQLPRQNVPVLTISKVGYFGVSHYSVAIYFDGHSFRYMQGGERLVSDPSHWMPLPEPPEDI